MSWYKPNQKWQACIYIDGKHSHLGYFDDEETAARKFDEHAARLGRPLNFPSEGQAQETIKGKSSKFRGVCWKKLAQKWLAQIYIDGKTTHLGSFDDEEAAARNYDEHAARLGFPLNYPPTVGQTHQINGKFSQLKGQKRKAKVVAAERESSMKSFGDDEITPSKYDKHPTCIGQSSSVLPKAQHEALGKLPHFTEELPSECYQSPQDEFLDAPLSDSWVSERELLVRERDEALQKFSLERTSHEICARERAALVGERDEARQKLTIERTAHSLCTGERDEALQKLTIERTAHSLCIGERDEALQKLTIERTAHSACIGERDEALRKLARESNRVELLDSMVHPLESMRRDLKQVALDVKGALLEAGVPSKRKRSCDTPFYYEASSWAAMEEVPWLEAERRAMTPAEGVAWLLERQVELERQLRASQGARGRGSSQQKRRCA